MAHDTLPMKFRAAQILVVTALCAGCTDASLVHGGNWQKFREQISEETAWYISHGMGGMWADTSHLTTWCDYILYGAPTTAEQQAELEAYEKASIAEVRKLLGEKTAQEVIARVERNRERHQRGIAARRECSVAAAQLAEE